MGIAVQPGTAKVQTNNINEDEKDILFQTIIDIANNKDLKNLIDIEKNNGFFLDFDYKFKNIYRKILFNNPGLYIARYSLLFIAQNSDYEFALFILLSGRHDVYECNL